MLMSLIQISSYTKASVVKQFHEPVIAQYEILFSEATKLKFVSPDLIVRVLLPSNTEWCYCTHHCCLQRPPSGSGAAAESGSLSRPPGKGEELAFTIMCTVMTNKDLCSEASIPEHR